MNSPIDLTGPLEFLDLSDWPTRISWLTWLAHRNFSINLIGPLEFLRSLVASLWADNRVFSFISWQSVFEFILLFSWRKRLHSFRVVIFFSLTPKKKTRCVNNRGPFFPTIKILFYDKHPHSRPSNKAPVRFQIGTRVEIFISYFSISHCMYALRAYIFLLLVAPPQFASLSPQGEVLPDTSQWTIAFDKQVSWSIIWGRLGVP